jgi:nicotinate-nucleotide adenylyltransferase
VLRLFIYFQGQLLKARKASPEEVFTHPVIWNEIEFEVIPSHYMMMMWTSLLPDLPSLEARKLIELVGARYPFSPHYQALKKLSPEIVFQDGDEWVCFGGSFNPWHGGHQACLNLLPEDKTCFVIPDRNPYKELRELNPVSTILELSSKVRYKKNQFLAPTFLLDVKKNPTVEWIVKLHQEFPAQKLSLLIGFDSFIQISNWTQAEELLTSLHKLYVVSRMETDLVRQATARPTLQLAPKLEIEFLGHHGFEDLSSTELRKKQLK